MKRIIFYCLVLVILSTTLQAQTRYSGYSWNSFPEEKVNDSIKSKNGTLVLLERIIREVFINKENSFEEILVYHRKVRVETTAAVSQNNKIYIPTGKALDIISIQARFISPEGKVTELPQASIKQVENLEDKGDFKTFAIEGAETGGQIEYFYIIRAKFTPYGGLYTQDSKPKANVDIIFSYPSKLEYMIKSYNGFTRFEITSDTNGITEQRARSFYIPALEEEKFSFYKASLQRYEYTLAYNNYNSNFRTYSWSKIAERLYEIYYEPAKNEVSEVRSWLKEIKAEGTDARIREIENRVKSEIALVKNSPSDIDLEQVLKTKQANDREIIRLFITIFVQEGIEFNLVSVSDRGSKPFDPDFNGWNYIDDFMLFFPSSGKFLVPDDQSHRYGSPSAEYQDSYAMFFRPVSYRDQLHSLGYEIRFIPSVASESVSDSMLVALKPNLSAMNISASTHRVFGAEFARNYQVWWHLWDESRRKEVIKAIFDMGDQSGKIESYAVKNNQPSDIDLNPFIWDVRLVSGALMEKAGEDILVKIGESIGRQSEMYQTGPRETAVSIEVLHNYFRRVEMEIPEGWHLGDIGSLKMNVSMMNKGKPSCFFRSDAFIEQNKLIIICEESYTELSYPKERFEEYRSVINAAADFNKKTVLLSKN